MSNLIKNELTKIFKKKSIYIVLVIVLGFMIFISCMNKFFSNGSYDQTQYESYLKQSLGSINPSDPKLVDEYISVKSQLEAIELQKKYDIDSWQRVAIDMYVSTDIFQMNQYKYGSLTDDTKFKEAENKYLEKVKRLDNGQWKLFVEDEIKDIDSQMKEQEDVLKEATSSTKPEVLRQIESLKIQRQVAKWRIDKDIPFGSNYKNQALSNYQHYAVTVYSLENTENLRYSDKLEYQQAKRFVENTRYDIENNKETGRSDNAFGELTGLFSNMGMFIVVAVVMIAGSIVSDEFSKGTIKLLLVRPYSRNKILLSKFITCVIMLVITIVVIIGMQFLVSGIIHGFDSYQASVIEYDFNANAIKEVGIGTHLLTQSLTRMPIYIGLMTLAFMISTIFNNTALAVTIGILGFIGGDMIVSMLANFTNPILKILPMMNWDLSVYLYGGLPVYEGLTMGISSLICLVYFVILMVAAFVTFKKKNIKNI